MITIQDLIQRPYRIEDIENPSKLEQMTVVGVQGYSIRYISNPCEDVQMAAIKQDFNSMRYIKNPTQKVQLESIKQDEGNIYYIKPENIIDKELLVEMLLVLEDKQGDKFFKKGLEVKPIKKLQKQVKSIKYKFYSDEVDCR